MKVNVKIMITKLKSPAKLLMGVKLKIQLMQIFHKNCVSKIIVIWIRQL